MHQTLIVEVYQ